MRKRHAPLPLILTLALTLVLGACASKEIPPELAQQANIQADVESLKQQVRALRGEVENLKYQLGQVADPDGGGLKDMAGRMNRLESNVNKIASQLAVDLGGGAPAAAGADGQAPDPGQDYSTPRTYSPAAPMPSSPASSSARADEPADALYSKAMKAYDNRNYSQAQSLWAEFYKNYPKHSLAPNALFWQGEAYFQQGDYARAALSYQEVVSKFPKNAKVPSSYLKQGQSFIKLGNKKAGELVLQDLVKKFPDTPEARRAKDILAGR